MHSATARPPYTLMSELAGPALPEIPREDLQRYSIARALRIAAGGQSGRGTREQEIHDALMPAVSRLLRKRSVQGFLVPTSIMGALDASTSTAGQELVFTSPGTFLDGLRARSVVASMGASILEAPLPFSEPRLDSDVTVAWVAEDPGSDVADSEPTLGSVDYTLKTLATTVPYSQQLLRQSSGLRAVDQVVSRAAEAAIGAEWDRVSIQGSGASNEPTGVLNTAGIGDVDIGANGGAPTYDHMVDLEHDVAAADAEATRMGFVTTPGVRRKLRNTEEFAGAGPVWRGGRVLGHPAAATTNVPSNLADGTGTNLHAVILGDWAQLGIAMIPVLDVVVDPFRLKKQALVEAVFYWYGDVQLRHAAGFSAVQDADPS